MYTIKILNLKTCLIFEATWKTFVKNVITEKVLFSIKTLLHINKRHTLSKIKIDQNCGEMRSNKTSFNLHRILEFAFRNISLRQTIALPIPQILELANYQRGILG